MKKIKTTLLDSDQRKKELQQKVRELTRDIIGGLKLSEIVLPEKLEGQDRINFARYCHETYHSPYFNQIIEALYYPQIMFAVTQAPDYDQVTFARASTNGVMLVAEIFQKWSNIYDEDYSPDQKPKDFDPTKSFETIKD